MDFDLTDEQRLLNDSVERLFADQYALRARKRYAQEPGGYSRALWAQYAELGLLGAAVRGRARRLGRRAGRDHDRDGSRSAVRSRSSPISRPSCSPAGCCGSAAARRSAPNSCRRSPAANSCSPSPTPSGSRATISPTSRRARGAKARGYVLDGAKSLVLHGDSAGKFIVSARLPAASATATARRCSWSMPRRTACRARLSRRSTACAPPR